MRLKYVAPPPAYRTTNAANEQRVARTLLRSFLQVRQRLHGYPAGRQRMRYGGAELCCARGIAMQAKSVCLQRDFAAVHAGHLLIAHDFQNALCGLFGFGQQGLRMLSWNDPAVAAVAAIDISLGRCAQTPVPRESQPR